MGTSSSKVSSIERKKNGDTDTLTTMIDDESSPKKFLDPRSPNPFRTPISNAPVNAAQSVIRAQNLTDHESISTSTAVTPTKLKTKLLRDLGYTLDSMDPRSPALNRTPIAFNDSNMSDDFSLADLSLSESNLQTPTKEIQRETFFTPVPEDGKVTVSTIDPRSPSIDIERTPLTLNVVLVDVHTNEDSHSPVVGAHKNEDSQSPVVDAHKNEDSQSPVDNVTNEPIEEETTAATTTETVRNLIYIDENQEQPLTPNVNSANAEKTEKTRTPLSCLRNAQSCDNRNDTRLRMHNKPMLARAIFKDAAANHNANKTNNSSSSKIPVMRRSMSKEVN